MFLPVRDTVFHVAIEGPEGAPPLLLLHSLGTDLAVWEEVATHLRGQFRLIRPDLRGHGLSGVTPGPYDIGELARDMLGVLDGLDIAAVHVAGLSIGGVIAQALAAEAPNRVLSLMLCDTATKFGSPEQWRDRSALVRREGVGPLTETTLARWVTPDFLASPAAEGLRAMLRRTSPEGYAAAAESLATADLTETTRGLSVPALVLVGEHDLTSPVETAEALAALIPGARLEIIAGTAHLPTMQEPELVALAMRRFLGSPSQGSGGI